MLSVRRIRSSDQGEEKRHWWQITAWITTILPRPFTVPVVQFGSHTILEAESAFNTIHVVLEFWSLHVDTFLISHRTGQEKKQVANLCLTCRLRHTPQARTAKRARGRFSMGGVSHSFSKPKA